MAKNHTKQITRRCARILSGIGILTLALTGLRGWTQTPPTPAVTDKASTEQEPPATSSETSRSSENHTTPKPMPASQRLAAQTRQLLAQADSPASPVWINVQGRQVLGFWHADASGTPLGAVLMLHDQGHSPLWPNTLRNLHTVLPRFGWATLSIEMPALAPPVVPDRTRMEPPLVRLPNAPANKGPISDTEKPQEATPQQDGATEDAKVDETKVVYQEKEEGPGKSPEKSEPLNTAAKNENPNSEADKKTTAAESSTPPTPTAEEVEQTALATMQAGLDYLQQQNQFNIVLLGEGYGAARALKFIVQAEVSTPPKPNSGSTNKRAVVDRPVRALVLLDADLPDSVLPGGENGGLTELIQHPEVPILDLITSVDFTVRANAAERKRVSRKMHYQTYSSRRLMPQAGVPSNDQESDITKSIRGFLTQHAQGVEL